MNLISKIRLNTFWLLDSLKGGYLKKDLADIKECFEITSFSLLKKRNSPVLRNLLNTAVNSTKFYSDYKSFKTLEDFPVVNKSIIKNNFDDINIIPTNNPELLEASSSGSTGTPFKVYQTKRKARRNKADVIFFANAVGYTIGDQLIFIRLWMKKYRKSPLFKKLINIIEVDVEDDLTDEKIAQLVSKIKTDKQAKGFIGYPSGFEKICKYLDKVNSPSLNCNIKSIIATSESLYDNVRQKMEYYFDAPIVSRYSNEENGILSQQMVNDSSYTINWASFFVEILDINKDEPAKPGELGRVVVTDLYNLATPLIRYDTGDLGKFCNNENDNIPKFEVITGRKKDTLYNTKGDIVNSFIVYNGLTKFPELNQFQIIQYSKKDYTFKINIDSKFAREQEFISYYKSYLGDNSNISIEYVNEIPALSSGKRRVIINLHKENAQKLASNENY
ncbi:CoF synthetase [Algibacter marinivivus]|uniref:CoF synthetase n=1 Tax=Algibacter marinivivus TaxID=2100723 RepID=A0A2U2X3S4_9FLAO|nr:phenylacetate--CoA ligase family protein [Algibacter marinivivus]PWH82404.1 CoF synthetase [Algibacter marinivivus]